MLAKRNPPPSEYLMEEEKPFYLTSTLSTYSPGSTSGSIQFPGPGRNQYWHHTGYSLPRLDAG
jgi:hypothetical protein